MGALSYEGANVHKELYSDTFIELATTSVGAVYDTFMNVPIDGLGTRVDRYKPEVDMHEKTSRLEKREQFVDYEEDARYLASTTYFTDILRDKDDFVYKMQNSRGASREVSNITTALNKAVMTKKTIMAMKSLFSDVREGQNVNNTTASTFPAGNIVPFNATGALGQTSEGLTIDKLEYVAEKMSDAGVPIDENNPLNIVCFQEVMNQFKYQNIGTNSDAFPVVDMDYGGTPMNRQVGSVRQWGLYRFHILPKTYWKPAVNSYGLVSGQTTRFRIPVYHGSGMAYGTPTGLAEYEFDMVEMKETRHDTIDFQATLRCGATRVDDNLVYDVNVTATAFA